MKKILLLAATVLMTGTALKAQVTVTGGATASYTSLGAAFAAINVGTHTGAITVDISASITETASAILNSSGEGGSSYTSVLIFPSVDGVVINGPSTAASGRGVIELNGADNVTVDGDNPNTPGINKNLTIVNNNPNTTTYASVIRVATHTVTPQYNNADNIAIKNLILNGNATGRNVSGTTSTTGSENTTFGVVVGPNGGSSVSALTSVTGVMNTTTTANAFSVDNCSINSVARGIVFNGNTSASSSGVAFTNNVIGSAGTLTGNPPYNSPATTVYSKAIFIQGVSSAVITGNIIQNILSYVGTTFSGIELNTAIGAGNVTISSNTITGVVNNGSGAVNAVSLLASTGAYMITSNIINNIQSSTSSVMGVNISSGATAGLIENNKISYVYARSTSGFAARGILLGGGNAITVRNNFIWDLNAVSNNNTTGTTFGVRGISITSGTNHFIHHNTISLSGPMLSGGSSPDITTCLSIAGTGQTGIDVRNNLFSNTMSGGNSGAIHTIIQLPTGGTSAMNLSINNNAYFGSSTVNVGLTTNPTAYSISNFNSGATTPATNWRAYTSTLGNTNNDNASFALTTAAPFISASNLHINNALPVFLESAGATIGVTSDIDGDVRPGPVGSVNGGGTAPDIGADEFDGIPLVANDIAATAFVSPTNGGGVGQSMNFSPQASFSNLGSSGQTNFNVIYRIINSSNAVVYTQTNVVASLNSLATTTVTFPVTSLATAGTYTIRAIASLAGDMATVNDSISGTMSILAPLCGTYNIGAAQAFPFNTLTNAITRLNQVGVSCGVTFLLDDASYSTSETFPLVINPVLGGSSTNTVLIRPNVGVTSTVTGSGSSIFKLFNTYYVTIDGMNAGGSSLTLNNTNSGASAVVWLASTASTGPGNNNIGINNITAIGGGTTSSSSFGIVAGVDGATP
ncbi:MAG: hypothetical protein K0S32_254 [Bacteroidetes bacterium]|nr:hypothetical protein [Bacteroidota bacterium]